MMAFYIKSTICLVILYAFYHVFLQQQKILLFNRFYLIFSLAISMIIPLIDIPVRSNFLLTENLNQFTSATVNMVNNETTIEGNSSSFSYKNILTVLYIIISSVILSRFVMNIFRITKKITKSIKSANLKTTFVLVEERVLPYSFLGYIFVNRHDYENGKIEDELLIHEEAHCLQYHSIDILFVELLNVLLWFNPAIWFYRKAILMNHEFLADEYVLTSKDPVDYQQILLNVLLRNNSNCLISNFKQSIIKNRINMMTKVYPLHMALLRKILAVVLFLFMAFTLTFSQEIKKPEKVSHFENEWWYPILKKHNLDPLRFNNFDKVFEMGSSNSISEKRIVTLNNAFFLIKQGDNEYMIIKASIGHHDLNKNIIDGDNGVTIEQYSINSTNIIPLERISCKSVSFDIDKNKVFVSGAK